MGNFTLLNFIVQNLYGRHSHSREGGGIIENKDRENLKERKYDREKIRGKGTDWNTKQKLYMKRIWVNCMFKTRNADKDINSQNCYMRGKRCLTTQET